MDRRMLLVHAHPDDESIFTGVTMAKYVAEGVGVTLVTCTLGEMGEVLVDELAHLSAARDDTLGEHRADELAVAMRILGVTDHRLLGGRGRWRDSGMKWADDGAATVADDVLANAFWHADLTEAADELVAVIREVRPQVLVTYDPFGGYGHPDHVQAHRVATYGASLAAVRTHRPDLGEPWDIAKIYWSAFSAAQWRDLSGDSAPPFAIEDDQLDTVIAAPEFADTKMDAMRAHGTQIRPDGQFFAMGEDVAVRAWGWEYFRLAKGARGPVGDDGLETDLFAGL